jgi:hypothetical protein
MSANRTDIVIARGHLEGPGALIDLRPVRRDLSRLDALPHPPHASGSKELE